MCFKRCLTMFNMGCVLDTYMQISRKKSRRGTLTRNPMMGVAKVTYYQAFEEKYLALKKVNVKAWEWLEGKYKKKKFNQNI